MSPGSGRFAPSPSGHLHLGNLRTALIAWLLARSEGRRFLIRFEDLDSGRCRPEYESSQIADLLALGLDYDGPIVRQSQRIAAYDEALATLDRAGLVYPCWCSRAEIRAAVSAPHGSQASDVYPGTCRQLTRAERAARERSGRTPALRFAASDALIAFSDRFHGICSDRARDVVLRRGDGQVAYNLAVVVDDGAQSVGQIVRGDDLLASTATQAAIADQLDLPPREYAHVPLILGPGRRRLAKRDGAVTLADRRALGEDAAAVRGRLAASLGLASCGECPTLTEILTRFDPHTLPSAAAQLQDLDRRWGTASR